MLQPIPYLSFDGNCAEAMRFYAATLGGKLGMMSNRQSLFAGKCPREHLDRIAYARLELDGELFLCAGDCPPERPYEGMPGIVLALSYENVSNAEQTFSDLGQGGQIIMSFDSAFWAEKFGMVIDQFGCGWAVNGRLIDLKLEGEDPTSSAKAIACSTNA
jgi:PhnB protein